VLALPDTGPRVLSLSETHGPSLVDSVGILIVVAGWLPVPILLYRSRALVSRFHGWWWLPSAAALALAQAIPLMALASPPRDVTRRRPATPRGGAG
jgi:hypothetical protein